MKTMHARRLANAAMIFAGLAWHATELAAQSAPEWAVFVPPAASADFKQPLTPLDFADINQEGPWKASEQAMPSADTVQLLALLEQKQWAQARDWLKQKRPQLNTPDMAGRTPLTLAASAGQLGLVQDMLRRGADPDLQGVAGQTPLGESIFRGDELEVKALLQHGARLDWPDSKGQLPLHVACVTGNSRIIEQLIQAGADWRWPNKMGHHAISEAAYHGQIDAMKTLLAHGAKLGEPDATRLNAVHAAALNKQLPALRWLHEQGVRSPSPITAILIKRIFDKSYQEPIFEVRYD